MNNSQKTIRALFFIFLMFQAHLASADIVYQLENFPSDQDGAQLTGSITTDGTVGGFITEANILGWNFTVDKSGNAPYSVNSTDSGAEFHLGSQFDLQATATELQLSGILRIGKDLQQPVETYVEWRASGIETLYLSGLTGNLTRGWETYDPVSFGSGSWTIAAVPEPTTITLILIAGSTLLVNRRLKKQDD